MRRKPGALSPRTIFVGGDFPGVAKKHSGSEFGLGTSAIEEVEAEADAEAEAADGPEVTEISRALSVALKGVEKVGCAARSNRVRLLASAF